MDFSVFYTIKKRQATDITCQTQVQVCNEITCDLIHTNTAARQLFILGFIRLFLAFLCLNSVCFLCSSSPGWQSNLLFRPRCSINLQNSLKLKYMRLKTAPETEQLDCTNSDLQLSYFKNRGSSSGKEAKRLR